MQDTSQLNLYTNQVKFEDTMGKKHKINFRRAVKKVILRNYKQEEELEEIIEENIQNYAQIAHEVRFDLSP